MLLKNIFMAMLILCVFNTSAYSEWSDYLQSGWDKAKKIGDKTITASKDFQFWREKSITNSKNDFRNSVNKFDDQQRKVGHSFTNGKEMLFSFSSILKNAKDKDEAFKNVHDKWQGVKSEIEHLQFKFKCLVKSADELFVELDKRANTITDENLKETSVIKIETNKQKYINRLKKTKDSIFNLTKANIKVTDMITALEISYTLNTLAGQIEKTFKEIDGTITEVMSDLASLSVESKALLNNI